MRRIAIKIEYDGTDFLGWQLQAEGKTVQGIVEEAARRATSAAGRVRVQGASRTDTGVHAEEQVAHFDTRSDLEPAVLVRALNYWLPQDVSVLTAREAGSDFDARFSAVGKLYRYRVICSRERRPLTERCCLRAPVPLDLPAMQQCASQVIGERDFTSFTSAGGGSHGNVRTVLRSEWIAVGEELHFLIQADGFTYNMVRALVGTMLEVGRGKLSPRQFDEAMNARDRRAAGPTAPPHGLTLVRVFYPPATDPFASRRR